MTKPNEDARQEELVFEYPAVYTLEQEYFTIHFPDLPVEPFILQREQMAESFEAAADVMGNYISECLLFGTPLPQPTSLSALALEKNQKGVMIKISGEGA